MTRSYEGLTWVTLAKAGHMVETYFFAKLTSILGALQPTH